MAVAHVVGRGFGSDRCFVPTLGFSIGQSAVLFGASSSAVTASIVTRGFGAFVTSAGGIPTFGFLTGSAAPEEEPDAVQPTGGWPTGRKESQIIELPDGSRVRVKNRAAALKLIAEFLAEEAPETVERRPRKSAMQLPPLEVGPPPPVEPWILPDLVEVIDRMMNAAEEIRIASLLSSDARLMRQRARDEEALLTILASVV